jgi:hypothetical protein
MEVPADLPPVSFEVATNHASLTPSAACNCRRRCHCVQEVMRPLAAAGTMLPPAAFRQDLGVARTAILRYLPQLLSGGPAALKLTGPFSKVGGRLAG